MHSCLSSFTASSFLICFFIISLLVLCVLCSVNFPPSSAVLALKSPPNIIGAHLYFSASSMQFQFFLLFSLMYIDKILICLPSILTVFLRVLFCLPSGLTFLSYCLYFLVASSIPPVALPFFLILVAAIVSQLYSCRCLLKIFSFFASSHVSVSPIISNSFISSHVSSLRVVTPAAFQKMISEVFFCLLCLLPPLPPFFSLVQKL